MPFGRCTKFMACNIDRELLRVGCLGRGIADNRALYTHYRQRAEATDRLLVCGRLGEYRYFDMDQAIGRAMTIAGRILQGADRHQLLQE